MVNHAPKGREVMISGSIEMEKFTDKSGVDRVKTMVKVAQVTHIGEKPGDQSGASDDNLDF